jgi:hypothetical protein
MVMMIAQLSKYTKKNHRIRHFKWLILWYINYTMMKFLLLFGGFIGWGGGKEKGLGIELRTSCL